MPQALNFFGMELTGLDQVPWDWATAAIVAFFTFVIFVVRWEEALDTSDNAITVLFFSTLAGMVAFACFHIPFIIDYLKQVYA